MNIAYLDPPYSRYFERLGACLARRTGGRVIALLSSPAYRLYTHDERTHVWPPGRAQAPAPLPPHSAQATWSQVVDDRFRGVFWHAVEWFRQRFQEEKIELCMVFSDARPFSLAASIAAADCGVRCVYFERGAFRFATASLSTQGLNARFSLRRARDVVTIEGLPADTRIEKRPAERGLRWHFARFIIANGLASLAAPDRRRLQHKRYAFAPYLRLALTQWWTEHHLAERSDVRLALNDDTPLVVVPLQLPADSQLRLHSPFESNQAFVEFVVAEARRVSPTVQVLVKRHPMDTHRYRMPDGAAVIGGNISRFFDRRPVVVCVNSTVGFEAAARGLPVICFGESFYTDSEAVALASPANFARRLAERLGHVGDAVVGRQLRNDVMRWYQAPGDAWAFTEADIEATAAIVLEHYTAAEPLAPAAPSGSVAPPLMVGAAARAIA